ncbi:hypothetical protein ABUW04_08290 [Streptacidiphilus sp. N1-10]|uniref:Uncharacterized protein n=1 Tax=Streptacidiphilus jeojiensis TaxID=3229225 RepID=A0ABV6XJJ9_9ACTN
MVQKSDSGTPPEGPRDPFAPPSKDAPDRPWQPRQPQHPQDSQHSGHSGHSGHPGQHRNDERGWATETPPDEQGGDSEDGPQDGRPPRPVVPPPHPWSPGYQGQQPPRPLYSPAPQAPRFDPTDPVQRRARYALLSGMWGIFFLILGVPYITLLLASLALYWAISSLRGTAKTPTSALDGTGVGAGTAGPAGPFPGAPPAPTAPTAPGAPPAPPGYGMPGYHPGYVPPYQTRPQVPAAMGGLIAAIVGLAMVATVFGVQLYYKSFYDCQNNALTKAAYNSCATTVTPKPPQWLVQIGG